MMAISCGAGVFDGADTQRFYITVLNYELQGGLHLSKSQLAVAVSISSNPADGFLGPYTIPTMGLNAGAALLASPHHSMEMPRTDRTCLMSPLPWAVHVAVTGEFRQTARQLAIPALSWPRNCVLRPHTPPAGTLQSPGHFWSWGRL